MATNLAKASRLDELEEWNKTRLSARRDSAQQHNDIIIPTLKFRVLIIGRSGVGKSTICSKIFRIDDQRIGIDRREKHDIKEGITFGIQNEKIIIHDCPGFETGSEHFDQAIQFIEERRQAQNLSDQLHCIWYCISCEDEHQSVHETEELFFSHLKQVAGNLPVIVIFTKFDKTINALSGDWMRKHFDDIAAGKVEPTTVILAVQRSSVDHFDEVTKKPFREVIAGDGIKVLRVTNPSRADYGGNIDTILNWCPEVGVDELNRATLEIIQNEQLRPVWAAAQNSDADMKLQYSVKLAIDRLPQPLLAGSSISNGATTFWTLFTALINDIRHTWNLVQDHPSPFLSEDIQHRILDAICDSRTASHLKSQASDQCEATHAPICPRMFAQLVAGLVMIHDQLFAMQSSQRAHTPYVTPLTELNLKSILERYKNSKLRKNLWSSIHASDFSGAEGFKERVGGIILEAVSNNREWTT